MIKFYIKKKSGMTLIEVSMALLIVAFSAPTLSTLQMRLSRTVFNSYHSIENVILLKNFYNQVSIKNLFKDQKPQTESVGNPAKKITYTNSAYKGYNNLLLERIKIEDYPEELVSLRFYPEMSLGKK